MSGCQHSLLPITKSIHIRNRRHPANELAHPAHPVHPAHPGYPGNPVNRGDPTHSKALWFRITGTVWVALNKFRALVFVSLIDKRSYLWNRFADSPSIRMFIRPSGPFTESVRMRQLPIFLCKNIKKNSIHHSMKGVFAFDCSSSRY